MRLELAFESGLFIIDARQISKGTLLKDNNYSLIITKIASSGILARKAMTNYDLKHWPAKMPAANFALNIPTSNDFNYF